MLIIDLLLAAAFVTGIAKTQVVTSRTPELLLIFAGGLVGSHVLGLLALDVTAVVVFVGMLLNIVVGMHVNYRRNTNPLYLADKVR